LVADQKFEENLHCSKKLGSAAYHVRDSMEFGWMVIANDGTVILPTKAMKYTNWKVNEPPGGRGKHCIGLTSLDDYKWRAVDCGDAYCYVCQRLGNIIAQNVCRC